MARPVFAWTLALAVALPVMSGCPPQRLEETEEETMCGLFVRCWYPGTSGSEFPENDPQWIGMADEENAQNIRRAYGTSGTCWLVDPMAGQEVDGETFDQYAMAESCGSSCACTILELCTRPERGLDEAPACADGATDPCNNADLSKACVMCESGSSFEVCPS